jgi:hypothetical protein
MNLSDANVSLALDLQKFLLHLVGINMLETTGNSAIKVSHTLKIVTFEEKKLHKALKEKQLSHRVPLGKFARNIDDSYS